MNWGVLVPVLIYEALIIGGVGYWLARKAQPVNHEHGEFALAGRSLPMSVTAITLALTVLGTAHILGVFEMTWFMGAAAIWFSIAHVILLVLVCFGTGLWFRRLEVNTVPEMLEHMFGENIRIAVSCVMAGVMFGILTLEAQGLGILFAAMTGWQIASGAAAGAALGVAYVIFAGMREIGWINLVNALVMYLGLVLATLYIAKGMPGGDFSTVSEHYVKTDQEFMLSILGTPEIMMTFALVTVVAVVFCQSINQMLLQPAMSARDERTLRRAVWVAAPVNGFFGVFAVVIALTAKSIPEFEALGPKVAATTMLVELLPGWLSVLLLASFLAAVLSTFAVLALCIATLFSEDIYRALYSPEATEQEVVRVTRAAIVVLAGVATVIASSLPPILAAINWLFSWLIPVFWLVVFGFLWRRDATVAAFTLLLAWLVNSLWSFTDFPASVGMGGVPNPYAVLVVSLLASAVGYSLFGGQPGLLREKEGA